MAKPKQLTPKMLHFARLVAGGKSQADAYREAYDPSESTTAKSVHTLASRLMSRVDIRSRVDGLIKARDQAVARSAVSAKTRIIERLDAAIDSPTDPLILRALEIYARVCGLMNSSLTVENKTSNPESVAALLQAKLDQLGLGASSAEDSAAPVLDPSSADRPADDQLN